MPIVHAIVLGVVQGLTEFLPVSSSGHLLLVPWLFGWDHYDDAATQKTFDVALHVGTSTAAIVYFRRDLARYITAGWKVLLARLRPAARRAVADPVIQRDGRIGWLLVLATVPAALVGLTFEDAIDERLGTPTIIAVSLIGFGVLLAFSDRAGGRRGIGELRVRDALFVGIAQTVALNPGTSRSGITITAARAIGFSRDSAARMSFLMMIPITLGAGLLKGVGLARDGLEPDLRVPMLVGIVTSGIAGWVAMWGLLRLVQTRSFTPFVVYRVAVGTGVLILVAANVR